MKNHKTIPGEILEALGGEEFAQKIGPAYFHGIREGLSFTIPKNLESNFVSHVAIVRVRTGCYTMRLFRRIRSELVPMRKMKNLSLSQLRHAFEETAGIIS